MLVGVVLGLFPPDLIVQVNALACGLLATHGIPLYRWSTGDLVQDLMALAPSRCHSALLSPWLDFSP